MELLLVHLTDIHIRDDADFEVLSEKLNCKTEDCSLSIEKKNFPYIKTSPYTNEFLETIPAFKASLR